MAIKNSRVRKLRRRTKALENFSTLNYHAWLATHVLPKNDETHAQWAEYATKRRQESEVLTYRVANRTR